MGKRYPRPRGRGRYPPVADDILLRKTISTLSVDFMGKRYPRPYSPSAARISSRRDIVLPQGKISSERSEDIVIRRSGGWPLPNHGETISPPWGRGRYPPAADDILLRKTISTLRVDFIGGDDIRQGRTISCFARRYPRCAWTQEGRASMTRTWKGARRRVVGLPASAVAGRVSPLGELRE